MSIFYKPTDGWFGDAIPFFWKGVYHVFYLKDYRDEERHGVGTPWFHVATRDLAIFDENGEALPRGHRDAQDLYVYTGSVVEHEGAFHCFYTGHNPHFRRLGKPVQGVMRAVSHDLREWTKDPDFLLTADTSTYEMHDWRDPFVFWNEQCQEFWMLLAARLNNGPFNRRGCIALCSSHDLVSWTIREPFLAPNLYYTHECPDLFRIGDWWYLLYSTFSDRMVTHYRMARQLAGPWISPPDDSLDGRAYYAAKTATDGARVFAFGWNATKARAWRPIVPYHRDDAHWQWGGSLVVHELRQRHDGTLAVAPPPEVIARFSKRLEVRPPECLEKWTNSGSTYSADVPDAFTWCPLGEMPDTVLLKATLQFSPTTTGCGLVLRADDLLESYYQVRIEPHRRRLVFDRWPRAGDQAFMIERALDIGADEPVNLTVIVEGSLFEIYVNDEVALSARGYDHLRGCAGLFVSEGFGKFIGVEMLGVP